MIYINFIDGHDYAEKRTKYNLFIRRWRVHVHCKQLENVTRSIDHIHVVIYLELNESCNLSRPQDHVAGNKNKIVVVKFVTEMKVSHFFFFLYLIYIQCHVFDTA